MLKFFLISCFLASHLTDPAQGLDPCEALNVINEAEADIVAVLKQFNKTLAANKQCADACNSDSLSQKEWKLAFRGTANSGEPVYYAYKDGVGIPSSVESGCKQVGKSLPCTSHYRNDHILDNWIGISDVALVIYKNNVRVHYVIFDGAGTTYMNWLDKARVKTSSWSDIKTSGANYFSIAGHQELRRSFFLNRAYGSCPNDVGWFVAVDTFSPGCPWEKSGAFPTLRYAAGDSALNWNDGRVASADYFAVLVRYFIAP